MATTDELLAEAEAEEESSGYDCLVIDADERTITVPESEALFGVYMDDTVERKYFLCPRYVDNEKIDMLDCTIKVNYVSSGGNIGTYIVTDATEYESDSNYVTFSWLLDQSVFDGNTDTTISFAVQATNGTNTFDTRIGTGNSYKTVAAESLYTQYAALLLQILAMIDPGIDATSDDAIISGIQAIIDTADASTASGDATIIDQINALIEGYGRGETVTVVDLSSVEVYVGDYADSDTLTVNSGAVNVYGRYITT